MGFDTSKFLQGLEDAVQNRIVPAAEQAVGQFGEHVIGKAQKLCPVSDTNEYIVGAGGKKIRNPRFTGHPGNLRDSGNTEDPVVTGTSIEQVIGFNANYAAAVHERLDQHHKVGQAKFLETAMNQEAKKLGKFVQDKISEALE